MDLKREKEVLDILDRALEQPTADRAEFLAATCGGRQTLLAHIEALLGSDEAILGEVAAPWLQPHSEVATVEVGKEIGDFHILERIGQGGMGEVFLAEESELQRKVALKLLRPGLAGGDFERRFKSERMILARLNHPHIAQLYAVGKTEQNQPYFAMEYVPGQPLDQYCDRNQLTIPQRLNLFIKVCQAVQFAHQHLIIHRDLKPSNILVNQVGEPKLLDFGIAKVLDEGSAPFSEATQTQCRLLTPHFASPEQIRGEPIGVASDIYTLGQILYLLLCGQHPFEGKDGLEGFTLQRALLEHQPKNPSTRVIIDYRRLKAEATTGLHRRTNDPNLAKLLRGDLDAIVLKTLRKDPNQRYSDVARLIEDIQAYQAGYPVKARRGAWSYVAGRFFQRNRWRVLAAALVVGSFATATAIQGIETNKERQRAQQEAQTAGQTVDILKEMFEISDPELGLGETITAKEILERGTEKIHANSDLEPQVRSRLLHTLGQVHMKLGLYQKARELLVQALQQEQQDLATLVELKLDLAELQFQLGEHNALADNLDKINPTDLNRDPQQQIRALTTLAHMSAECELFEESEILYQRALSLLVEHFPDDSSQRAALHNFFGSLHITQAQYHLAEFHLHEAFARNRQIYGEESPRAVDSMLRLGNLNLNLNQPKIAGNYLLAVYHLRLKMYGPNHPKLAQVLLSMGAMYGDLVDPRAEQVRLQALDIVLAAYGEEHEQTEEVLEGLGFYYYNQDDFKKAESYFQRSLKINLSIKGPMHSSTSGSLNNLGLLAQRKGDYRTALDYLEQSRTIREQTLPPNHPHLAVTYDNLGILYFYNRKYEEAEQSLRKSLAINKIQFGEGNPRIANTYSILGSVMRIQGRMKEAGMWYEKSYQLRADSLGENHPKTLTSRSNYALFLGTTGQLETAQNHLEFVLHGRIEVFGENHDIVASSYNNLASIQEDRGENHQAIKTYRKSAAIYDGIYPKGHPHFVTTLGNLGTIYQKVGDLEQAQDYMERGLAMQQAINDSNHRQMGAFHGMLGKLFQQKGDRTTATKHLRQALTHLNQMRRKNEKMIADLRDRLAQLDNV